MVTKRSISLSESSANFIIATTQKSGSEPKWSSAINSALEQYKMLLVYSMPNLTEAQWKGFIDVYRKVSNPAHDFPPLATYYVRNNTLLETIELSPVEQMSVAYFCQIYSLNDWKGFDDFESIKEEIINKLSS